MLGQNYKENLTFTTRWFFLKIPKSYKKKKKKQISKSGGFHFSINQGAKTFLYLKNRNCQKKKSLKFTTPWFFPKILGKKHKFQNRDDLISHLHWTSSQREVNILKRKRNYFLPSQPSPLNIKMKITKKKKKKKPIPNFLQTKIPHIHSKQNFQIANGNGSPRRAKDG